MKYLKLILIDITNTRLYSCRLIDNKRIETKEKSLISCRKFLLSYRMPFNFSQCCHMNEGTAPHLIQNSKLRPNRKSTIKRYRMCYKVELILSNKCYISLPSATPKIYQKLFIDWCIVGTVIAKVFHGR